MASTGNHGIWPCHLKVERIGEPAGEDPEQDAQSLEVRRDGHEEDGGQDDHPEAPRPADAPNLRRWRWKARYLVLASLDVQTLRVSGRSVDRFLTTVLMTDMVGSTELAAELGDRGWRELVQAPKVVSEMLGHTSVAITRDRYSHVMPTMQAEAVRRLDGSTAC